MSVLAHDNSAISTLNSPSTALSTAVNTVEKGRQEDEDPFVGSPAQTEDFYPLMAIRSLMKILRDPSLNVHHTAVVQAIMYIFKTLGLKCVLFIPQVSRVLLSSFAATTLSSTPDHAATLKCDEELSDWHLGILFPAIELSCGNRQTAYPQLFGGYFRSDSRVLESRFCFPQFSRSTVFDMIYSFH